MKVVSADWVVPVEGDPIRDGAVAIADDGTVAAVGPTAELGTGEQFEGCAIVPGFVDCHSHLEYAVYAGFGDGLPGGRILNLHLYRQRMLRIVEGVGDEIRRQCRARKHAGEGHTEQEQQRQRQQRARRARGVDPTRAAQRR